MPGTCRPCGVWRTSKARVVPGEGYLGAELIGLGEALGAEEEAQARPFVGKAGSILNQSLTEAGIFRSEIWLTNSVRCRPLNAAGNNRTPTGHELGCCRGYLDDELDRLPNKKVIIAFGASAAWSALEPGQPTGGVLENQGRVLWSDRYGCWVVITLHPAYVARKPSERIWLTFDLLKARRVLEHGGPPAPVVAEHRVVETFDDLAEMREEVLSAGRIAWDWETNGVDYVKSAGFCVSFATDRRPNFGWVVPRFGPWMAPLWGRALPRVDEVLREILTSDIPKVGHNAKFDAIISFSTLGVWPVNIECDTMIAHHLINNHLGERAHSLKRMSDLYTGYGRYDDPLDRWLMENGYSKDGKPNNAYLYRAPSPLVHPYNATDSVVTLVLDEMLNARIREADLWDVYQEERMPLVRSYMSIDRDGQRLDQQKLDQLGDDLAEIMDATSQQIEAQVGREINWNSPKQVSEYIYDERGFPVIARTETGAPSTKEEVLIQFAEEDPAIKLFLQGRAYGKLKGSFVDGRRGQVGGLKAAISADGYARTDTLFHVIETFRLATRKPFPVHVIPRPIVLWNCDVHALKYQFERCCEDARRVSLSIRSLIIPDDDNLLVMADYIQQEYAIAAILAGQRDWEEALLDRREDAHEFVMKLLSGRSIQEFVLGKDEHGEWVFRSKQHADEYKNLRSRFKQINFMILYRGGHKKLARSLSSPGDARRGIPPVVVDESEAARMIAEYYDRMNDVKWWQYRKIKEVRETGRVMTPFKTYRRLPGIFSPDKWDQYEAERQACNAPIQISGYHVLARGVNRLNARWAGKLPLRAPFPGKVRFTVHDETVTQIHWRHIEEGMEHMRLDLQHPHPELVGACGIPRGIHIDIKPAIAWGEGIDLKKYLAQRERPTRTPLLAAAV